MAQVHTSHATNCWLSNSDPLPSGLDTVLFSRSMCSEDPCWWIWNMGWMPESARIFLSHQVVAKLLFKKQDLRIKLVCLPNRMHGSWSVMPSKKTWMVVFSTIEYAIATWCHCCQLIQAHSGFTNKAKKYFKSFHTGPVRPFTIVNHPEVHPEIFTQEPKMTAMLRVAPAGKGILP